MATAFGPKPPSYHAIVDLDRKIRDFPVPVRLRPYCEDNESPKPTPDLYMQRWMVLSAKEWSGSFPMPMSSLTDPVFCSVLQHY